MTLSIEPATRADLPAIGKIWNQAIEWTTAVWYDHPKTDVELIEWFNQKRIGAWPILVARKDNQVAGYATYGAFRPHDGFGSTIEHSLYVDPAFQRQGVGRQLLTTLIHEARQRGLHVMVGGIEANNEASIALHQALGFVETGRLPEVGRKFGNWLTLLFMQKIL